MDPAWSVATAQWRSPPTGPERDEIWLRSQNGDFERPLVSPGDFGASETYLLASPRFSPDGQRIAYYRVGSDGNRIWISPTAGGPPVELFRSGNGQDLPDWSPDGAWIAYPQDSAGVVGRWNLAKSRVGARIDPVVVVPDIVPYSPVKWSKNGEWIAYNGTNGLSIVTPDGKDAHAVFEEPLMAFDWSDDGRRIYGIRQSDDYRHLTFTSIDVASRAERIINANLLPLPVAPQPVRGFARVSGTTFLTSIVHVNSDVWLLDGFNTPARGLWTRLPDRSPGARRRGRPAPEIPGIFPDIPGDFAFSVQQNAC